MTLYLGQYDLGSIKYFRPDNLHIAVACPYCKTPEKIDAADIIEYPERDNEIVMECDCGELYTLMIEIVMPVILAVEVEE